jgi:hypothetical protein
VAALIHTQVSIDGRERLALASPPVITGGKIVGYHSIDVNAE